MDYHRIYDELIEKRKQDSPNGYVERHHILPKCIGGGDESENLVALTPEEHYLAHQLLVKMHPDNHRLALAATMMIPKRSNKLYGWLRRRAAIAVSHMVDQNGEKNSQYGTQWICNIELRENKKISKDSIVPGGWVAGRNKWKALDKKQQRQKEKEKEKRAKEQEHKIWYDKYIQSGQTLREYANSSDFPYSHVTLFSIVNKFNSPIAQW